MYNTPMNERKTVQIISYLLIPLFLAILTYVRHDPGQLKQYGSWSLNLLAFILLIKPLAIVFPNKYFAKILSYRRELGVADVWLYLFHAQGMIFTSVVSVNDLFAYPGSPLFWGAIAGNGMLILGLTSNNIATRLLKRNWKRLHRIVYAVFFAALYHGSMMEGEPEKFYILGGIYIALKIAQIYKQSRKKNLISV